MSRAFGFSQLGTAAAEKADANLGANIVSVMQAGAFFGALFAYPLADKFGRKPGLLVAAFCALIGGLMQAVASGNLDVLYVGRVIEGLGLGAATMLTPVYISENAPSGHTRHVNSHIPVHGSHWLDVGVLDQLWRLAE